MEQYVLFGAAALLVRAGLGLYAVGVSRAKNSAGVGMRLLCDLSAAVLAFWAVGAAVLRQTQNGVFAVPWHLLAVEAVVVGRAGPQPIGGPLLFLAAMVSLASTLVPVAAGDRSRFFANLAAPVLLAGLVVPACGHWAWDGWLKGLGFVDAGGASFVHVAGGVCAAVAAWMVGPREGKYHRDGSASVIPGHSVPLAVAGVSIVLVGWVGYVSGAAHAAAHPVVGPGGVGVVRHMGDPSRAAFNVLLAAAGGAMAALAYGQLKYGKPDILLALLGVMGALVAVSGGAGVMATPLAVVTGAVAGVLVPWAAVWIDLIARIDDPAGAVAVQAVGGAWGTLAAGLLAPGTIVERLKHAGVQTLGLAAIAALAAGVSVVVFGVLKRAGKLRAKEADEFDGLDLAEHDIGAYPDFQQNTIKSYHLREA